MHIYKLTEFQSASGYWYCCEKDSVAKVGNSWWIPAEILGIRKDDYVKWLINNYHPTYINLGNTLIYGWDKNHYSDMHKFVLYINKKAREKGFMVE